MKLIKLFLSLLYFLLVLFVTYYLYIKFLKVDVVFYSSLFIALISLTVFSFLIFFLRWFDFLGALEKFQQVLICALLGYVFALSLPTVIDRSLSFYILEKLQQRGGGILLSKFDYIFTNEYVRESKLVDIRLTEQMQSGTIVIKNDCVLLTPKGNKIASFGQFFRKNLLPRKRLLREQYTDELVDPFKRSDKFPDYLCKVNY
jgi:hypothetical protein